MKHLVLSAMTVSVMAMSGLANAAEPFVAGKDYTVLSNPGKVEKPGMIEVREFFWYGCPHCYRLEPYVASWLASKPANINFVRSPAAMNPVWEQNARGYYAVDLMGLTNKVHKPLFDAIHQKNQRLFDQKSLANFYQGYGVDSNKFNAMFNSFAVSGKIAQSKQLAQAYQLDGVPALVVNGKYVVKGEDQKVIQVVNYLINKERAVVKKPAPAKK
ncbi:thiol:disulfide interchange protein DsbA/DsbL [Alkanindiges illinoisensis]|uniref:Thiol:disulfide interchange protein n=1 Tax=Alkanindiges illinoisensis TaxID=197183 RepID=A0A4Y7XBR5_9GAMM|nr:thiol:disulfide interchange protein DsbA/DsbL [Alkanindiges illinoisensis]TEU25634.1 thiol:disulfide interchange protein DsbA/DsbL [Alkanindiges illinoisensis]